MDQLCGTNTERTAAILAALPADKAIHVMSNVIRAEYIDWCLVFDRPWTTGQFKLLKRILPFVESVTKIFAKHMTQDQFLEIDGYQPLLPITYTPTSWYIKYLEKHSNYIFNEREWPRRLNKIPFSDEECEYVYARLKSRKMKEEFWLRPERSWTFQKRHLDCVDWNELSRHFRITKDKLDTWGEHISFASLYINRNVDDETYQLYADRFPTRSKYARKKVNNIERPRWTPEDLVRFSKMSKSHKR